MDKLISNVYLYINMIVYRFTSTCLFSLRVAMSLMYSPVMLMRDICLDLIRYPSTYYTSHNA